jgi:hypothetical protein
MRFSAFSAIVLGFGLAGVQLSACSNSADDCTATATCGNTSGAAHAGTSGNGSGGKSGNSAGTSSDGGATPSGGSTSTSGTGGTQGGTSGAEGGQGGEGGAAPHACEGDVSDDAACWTTEEHGIFVSVDSEAKTPDGTRAAPFKTIGAGIAAAAKAGKKLYVCLSSQKPTYDERLLLDGSADGISIYGGFECETWGYSATRKVAVASPEPIGLRIASLKKGAHLENLTIKAANGTGDGLAASSYGAFITNSQNVVLKRVELTAGDGRKGTDGTAGAQGASGAEPGADQKGKPASCSSPPATQPGGAWATASSCGALPGSLGGPGGTGRTDAGSPGGNGDFGTPRTNVVDPTNDNHGAGATVLGVKGSPGTDGSDGLAGAVGIKGAAEGTFAEMGFTPADGNAGKQGNAGQGGGGGGGSKGNGTCIGASGGAGGMGACGGGPGTGGKGGGASVALLSWNSTVTLEASKLVAKNGGAGGKGGAGGARGIGAEGASGGVASTDVAGGGDGGDGGNGGNGGSGSGGSGGPAYALIFSGSKPTLDSDSTLAFGQGGALGDGGTVASVTAPSGTKGKAAAELEVK